MKLSFAIPAHNEEAMIGGCLESVLTELKGNDYDVEIIVVDNASTDRTSQVAGSFDGVRVVSQPRKGLTWARHAGFLASTGDLIANIDADTRLPKGWLDTVYKEFSENENLVALSGPHVFYDMPKTVNASVRLFYYFGYLSYLINYYLLKNAGMLQGGNFIVKKSAMEKIGGYSLDFDFYEDTDIAHRIHKHGHVKFTFKLPIYASGRRLKKEGLVKSGAQYALNYFWILMFKKPYAKEFKDIRN